MATEVTTMQQTMYNLTAPNKTDEWNEFDNADWFPLSFDKFLKLHNLYLYVYPAILLFVMTSNSFVVIIFSKRHKRTSVEIFLTALAISDVLACVSGTVPYSYVSITGQSTNPIKSTPTCMLFKIGMAASFAFHNFSAWITTAMSLQKFIAVRFPVKGRIFISKKTTVITMIILMVFAIVHGAMELILFSIQNIPSSYNGRRFLVGDCVIYSSNVGVKMYLGGRILIHQFLPCSIIICTTMYLSYKMLHRKSSASKNISRTLIKRRSVLMICTVALVFFVGEIPSTVLISIRFYSKITGDYNVPLIYNDMDIKVWVSNFLIYISYACNFWIYIALSKEFKAQVKYYIRCKQCSKSAIYERAKCSNSNSKHNNHQSLKTNYNSLKTSHNKESVPED